MSTRPVLAVLMVDNYEDLMKACADTARSAVLARIDEKPGRSPDGGLLLKTEQDHYLFIFEERHYEHFVEDKFSVLDTIRDIKVGDVTPTLSIGIGKDADSMGELYKNANLSLEMALSRGGDQAVVRGKVDFAFYGGRSKTTEKRDQGQVPGHGQRPQRAGGGCNGAFTSWATASRTWMPWAPPPAFAAWPASRASRPRS